MGDRLKKIRPRADSSMQQMQQNSKSRVKCGAANDLNPLQKRAANAQQDCSRMEWRQIIAAGGAGARRSLIFRYADRICRRFAFRTPARKAMSSTC